MLCVWGAINNAHDLVVLIYMLYLYSCVYVMCLFTFIIVNIIKVILAHYNMTLFICV